MSKAQEPAKGKRARPAPLPYEATRYTFTIPNPAYPDEPEYVHVEARRGRWDKGPIEGWNIMRGGSFWTRGRRGFVYRPQRVWHGRWTLEEALAEAAAHAVPHVQKLMAARKGGAS
jgi:hypothetical protein